MTPDEYAARQALISAAVARFTQQFGQFFVQKALSLTEWLQLLQFLFPEIQRRRDEAATLARQFYDSQRLNNHPNLPRNDRPLEGTTFEHFVKNMDPARQRMSQMDSPKDAVTHLAMRAVREVENAGRQQIIHAVGNDPETHIVKGWARVATGRETCAWCLMLVSRGPVYHSAEAAGLHLDEEGAQRMIAAGEDVSDNMEQWHTGCDCKVVPVFKTEQWPGKEAADRALELWKEATREADRLIESGDARTNNRNKETINALRRRIDRGEIPTSEWAALTAA